jgi:hypothetical protein
MNNVENGTMASHSINVLDIYFTDCIWSFLHRSIPGIVIAAEAHFLQRRGQKFWAKNKKKGLKS